MLQLSSSPNSRLRTVRSSVTALHSKQSRRRPASSSARITAPCPARLRPRDPRPGRCPHRLAERESAHWAAFAETFAFPVFEVGGTGLEPVTPACRFGPAVRAHSLRCAQRPMVERNPSRDRTLERTRTNAQTLPSLPRGFLAGLPAGDHPRQWLCLGTPIFSAMRWYLTAGFSTMPFESSSTRPRWISCHGVWLSG